MGRKKSIFASLGERHPFHSLAAFLFAVLLLGGGSRGDILSLVILRPLAVIVLTIGLVGLAKERWHTYRLPLGVLAACVLLVGLHLVPLPPAIWQSVPGREIAAEAFALVGLSDVWMPLSLSPERGWNAFYSLAVPAAAMVLAARLSMASLHKLLPVFAGMLIVVLLVGALQVASGFDPQWYFYRVTNQGTATGLFANKNHTAAFLACMIILLPIFARTGRWATRDIRDIVAGALGIAAFVMTILTGSRGGLIFGVFALLTAGWLWKKLGGLQAQAGASRRGSDNRAWARFKGARLLVPAAAVLVMGLAVVLSQSAAFDRFVNTERTEERRIDAWMATIDFLGGYMPLGSGIGSFVEIFQVHEPKSMLALEYWNHAHNDYLEWVLEGGVVAILIILVALIGWLRHTRRLAKLTHQQNLDVYLGLAGSAILFVLGLWSLVDYPLRVPSLASLAAIAAIMVVAPGRLKDEGGEAPPRR